METFGWFTCLLAWLITLGFLLFRYQRGKRLLNLPPGPKPWPIIGNLDLIGASVHQSLCSLSSKFGPLMYLRFGSCPVVVVSSPEGAEAILKTHDLFFLERPSVAAAKYTVYNHSDLTWAKYGAYWRQARKLFVLELFSAKRLEEFKYIRVEETNVLLKIVYHCSRHPLQLRKNLMDFSSSVISRMAFGKNYLHDSTDTSEKRIMTSEEFKDLSKEFTFLNGVSDIGYSFPWLRFLDLQCNIKKMKAMGKKFDKFLEHLVNEHDERRKGVEDYVAKDFLDVLLQQADDPTLAVKLKRDNVKGLTLDLLLAGMETTASALEWAMSELLKFPQVMAKATQELDDKIGRQRWVEEEDSANLPYLNAIVKETLRLHPIVPLLVPRLSREHCKILGYDIPVGTRVLVNTWAIGRDPSIWGDPEIFRPERFLEKSIDMTGQNLELLSNLHCPAYKMGMMTIFTALANLLHGFNRELPQGIQEEEISMEDSFGLTTGRKHPIVAIPQPRLPAGLYMQ